jgi:hypothetical protein
MLIYTISLCAVVAVTFLIQLQAYSLTTVETRVRM